MADFHTNEVFYDNVRVPKRNMIGEKNRGFYVIATSLDFDRASATGSIRRGFDRLVEYARGTKQGGMILGKNPLIRNKLAGLAIEVEIARCLSYWHAWLCDQGLIPTYQAAMIKLFCTELGQRLSQCGMEMLGLYGQLQQGSKWAPLDGRMELGCRSSTHATIFGGTSEIMRTIIALRGLGLPA